MMRNTVVSTVEISAGVGTGTDVAVAVGGIGVTLGVSAEAVDWGEAHAVHDSASSVQIIGVRRRSLRFIVSFSYLRCVTAIEKHIAMLRAAARFNHRLVVP
jgi:hypothetical protein